MAGLTTIIIMMRCAMYPEDLDIKLALEAAAQLVIRIQKPVVITPELRVLPSEGYLGEYLERLTC